VNHPTGGYGPPPGGYPPPRPDAYGPPPHQGYAPPADGYGWAPQNYYGPAADYYGPPAGGHGPAAGSTPATRALAQPPERAGSGLSGVFVVLMIVAIVLIGAMGLHQGVFRVSVPSWAEQTEAHQSEPAAPVQNRTPLTTDQASALRRQVSPGLVDVTAELPSQNAIGAGTGIVLSSSGEVLTNNHVIAGAASLKVTDIGTGRSYPATVIGYDQVHDIALLRMRGASGLRTATLGDSETVRVGDQVAAIGNAGGLGGRPSVATGPVTALGRSITTSDELTGQAEHLTGLIEADADIRPGDSGGPMVDRTGRVVGVDVAASVDTRSQKPDGTGFAIPINNAMEVVSQIRSGSTTEAVHIGETALLGVAVTGLSDRAVRDALAGFNQAHPQSPPPPGPSATGAFVAGVADDSPADRAGLATGDVITSVNGTDVDSAEMFNRLIGPHRPGDRVTLGWDDADGQAQGATVVLVPGPPN
jgi:S1-C subfamily serine protease